jgi:hypothetical protein
MKGWSYYDSLEIFGFFFNGDGNMGGIMVSVHYFLSTAIHLLIISIQDLLIRFNGNYNA